MKPQMEAIELKQNSSLLAGSTPGYGGAGGGVADAPEMFDLFGMPETSDMSGVFNDPTWEVLLIDN